MDKKIIGLACPNCHNNNDEQITAILNMRVETKLSNFRKLKIINSEKQQIWVDWEKTMCLCKKCGNISKIKDFDNEYLKQYKKEFVRQKTKKKLLGLIKNAMKCN